MTREEFCSLPPSIALGLLYDQTPALTQVEKPKLPFAPKFDGKVGRKGGVFTWASEMLLADLKWWHDRAAAGNTGEYAEKNAKQAKTLHYWVEYRKAFPDAIWSGERDRVKAVAHPPTRDPETHPWGTRGAEPEPAGAGFANVDPGDDGEIPFIISDFSCNERWW